MNRLTQTHPFRFCALAALMASLSGSAWAERGAPSEQELADKARAGAIAAIGSAREGTITDLLNQWAPSAAALGYPADAWAAEFASMLQGASDAQLNDIQNAADYDGVRAILQGRSAPVALDGVVGIENLGDSSNDLTFTPSVPCRVIDTRYDSDGATKPGTYPNYYNYYVYGTAATLYTQGHNLGVNSGPGCPAPKGEPAGIAANFTVASPAANGNIRAWPYGGAQPTVSLLNYQANSNLANAAIVSTCYGCGPDISIMQQYGLTHWIVDTMGFFYPAGSATAVDGVIDFASSSGYGSDPAYSSPSVIAFIGPTLNMSVSSGEAVHMNVNKALGSSTGANNLYIWACYKGSAATTPTAVGGGIFNLQTASNTRVPIGIHWVFEGLASDTYTFGMCGYDADSDVDWNNNEYGYITLMKLKQ